MITITNDLYWNAHKTTDKDRRMSKDLIRASKDVKNFDDDARREILKEVRRLIGFNMPIECLVIIKSYLLLPRDLFFLKQQFWQYIKPLPCYHLMTILELELGSCELLSSGYTIDDALKMDSCTIDDFGKWDSKLALNMVLTKMNKLPVKEQISTYTRVNQYYLHQDSSRPTNILSTTFKMKRDIVTVLPRVLNSVNGTWRGEMARELGVNYKSNPIYIDKHIYVVSLLNNILRGFNGTFEYILNIQKDTNIPYYIKQFIDYEFQHGYRVCLHMKKISDKNKVRAKLINIIDENPNIFHGFRGPL